MRFKNVGRGAAWYEPTWYEHPARGGSRASQAPQRGCPAGDPARPCHRRCHDLTRVLSITLSLLLLFESTQPAIACGPTFVEPVFVFTNSPDLPFAEFAGGKIGIVQSTFGSKTLVIAYRYLNGGAFTSDEQKALVEALRASSPEDDGGQAIKAWVAARKEFLKEGEKLPDIYTERKFTGYDFFPNCARNAFEVATETLKDRATKYGAEDRNLRAWLTAQDMVFQNCSAGATLPQELGPESPAWLRKDRDYQIAAALFYSLNFDAAQARFERIAADTESPWQRTADYLVARTLVRRASLLADEKQRQEAYEQAELRLQMVLAGNGAFYDAALRLLGLVKYRAHPRERIRELGRALAQGPGNANLRQDLIDYVWLRERFNWQIARAQQRRKEASENKNDSNFRVVDEAAKARSEAMQRGELFSIGLYPKKDDGEFDYSKGCYKDFKYDATEAEILQAFESEFGRKLTPDEIKAIQTRHASEVESRRQLLSPNRKVADASTSPYEECHEDCDAIAAELPDVLRADDLSDWVFSLESKEPDAYSHAISRWHNTGAPAWLFASLAKADKSSPQVAHLIRAAEKVAHDDPAFPSFAYHLIRLQTAAGRTAEARQLVDEIISWPEERLPVSARNQFIEQRMKLAENLTEFLKFAPRKPVVFYDEGSYGTISDLLKMRKSSWDPDYYDESKEEYEREIDDRFKELLPWDDQSAFDDRTIDVFNWHFPLELLATASHNRVLPKYLRRHLILAVWTRAILLENEAVAQKMAPEVSRVAPEMSPFFDSYVNAQTARERKQAALYVLLKFPNLSPLVPGGIPTFVSAEESLYYFESAWWCQPATTEYRGDEEVPKVVPPPGFLSPLELATARKELARLTAVGDAKSYLGKQVIEWAKDSPNDPRLPEALFIAVKANESYKYGCNSWENDEETKNAAETLLQEHYPQSPWTAKLHEAGK